MAEGNYPIVWLIDENDRELRLHRSILQKAISDRKSDVNVQPVPARSHIGDYHDILQDSRTVAIIVDQRLNEVRGIDHTGIELSKRLRSLAPKLPIYILTNYAQSDDFLGDEWSVEDILPKDHMHDADKLKTFVARLLRRIDLHQAMVDVRDTRFRELLKKSLLENLSKEEQEELESLQFERTALIVSDEVQKLQRLEKALERLKDLKASYKGD